MMHNQKEAMDIEQRIDDIRLVVEQFEEDLRDFLNSSIEKSLSENTSMTITIKSDYIIISDSVDAEQVDYLVYIEQDSTQIEATKAGFAVGYLEHDSELYLKLRNILKPIEDTYRTFFSWDGREFVTNLK